MTEPFGKALKRLREDAGLTALELQRKTGIARSHLYRLESGEIAEPNVETLNLLADALGVDPEDLYEIAWQTTGTGPGLPSMTTYFRAKYELDDDQIAKLTKAFNRVAPDQPEPLRPKKPAKKKKRT